jgi:hypothetical protein
MWLGGCGESTAAFDGFVGEVVFYQRKLADAELLALRQDLVNKWISPSPPSSKGPRACVSPPMRGNIVGVAACARCITWARLCNVQYLYHMIK